MRIVDSLEDERIVASSKSFSDGIIHDMHITLSVEVSFSPDGDLCQVTW